ncbi:MAG: Holliday junction resolvase RuvX [Oscillospiraceae bacterium]|nr:Holliday junction resolvase RuvX [Oscillospiraceae bacterium]
MIIFGVDFGDTRTGWAVCDAYEMMASPAGVLTERSFQRCVEQTAEAAKKARAELIVVGHPKNMNGSNGPRAEKCEAFAHQLEECSGIPVQLWDERCTTVSAHQILNVTDTRGKKRKAVVDAVAATIILESYLAYRKNQNLK